MNTRLSSRQWPFTCGGHSQCLFDYGLVNLRFTYGIFAKLLIMDEHQKFLADRLLSEGLPVSLHLSLKFRFAYASRSPIGD